MPFTVSHSLHILLSIKAKRNKVKSTRVADSKKIMVLERLDLLDIQREGITRDIAVLEKDFNINQVSVEDIKII